MKKSIFVSVILLMLLISGCTQPPANDETGNGLVIITEPTYGTLNLSITDAPIEGLKVLNITISEIEVHNADGEWILFSEEEQTFDLMQLNGVSELLGEETLETGSYTQIRLDVVSADLELEDSTTAEVIVPSDKIKIVRSFTITEDTETELIIDFKPESVKATNDTYKMTPVLKIMNAQEFREHVEEIEAEETVEEEPEEQEGTEETGDEGTDEPVEAQGATGNLAIYLKDAPTDEIETLNITFSKLEAHKTGGKWFTISEEEQTFDLLQLQDVSALFGENTVEAGHYTMLRLEIVKATLTLKAIEVPDTNTPDNNSVDPEPAEPEEIEVTIPSNTLRFNHQFYIGDGETTEILIDFLIDKSMTKTGKGDWKLRPTVKIITLTEPEVPDEEPEELCGNSEVDEGEDCSTCAEDVTCEEGYDCLEGTCVETIELCGNAEVDEGENCETCVEDVLCEEGFECVETVCTEIELCGNGTVDEGEDCSTCAEDVTCEEGYECSEGTCTEITLCGNGTVDDGEDCSTCIEDVPCDDPYQCIGGSCVNMV